MAELTLRKRRGGLARTLEGANKRVLGFFEVGNRLVNEPFVGVRTTEGVEDGLFKLEETKIPTIGIQKSVEAFLEALNEDQRAESAFDIDNDAWRRWSNIQNFLMRHGTCLEDMDDKQRNLALDILRASFSEQGFELTRAAMIRNGLLGEISGNVDEFGEWLYWISIFGTPSATEPWGWQIDGHHVNISCFIVGDQVVLTPMFLGSEPEIAEYSATRLLEDEENAGLRIMDSLSPDLRAKALQSDAIPNDVLATSFMDNLVLDYAGVNYEELNPQQQSDLVDLIWLYVSRMAPGQAEAKMADVKRHIERTHFAWMGGTSEESVFYYRIHNPVLIIEFDHIAGVVFDRSVPNRNHIHTVMRTPNGNDYGKVLLQKFRDK